MDKHDFFKRKIAWLAQSVERETLTLRSSQGCGFKPHVGLFFFCLFWPFFCLLRFRIYIYRDGANREHPDDNEKYLISS
jgi:hypothetical protein